MHKVFWIFITLNGQPVGETTYVIPVTADCRHEHRIVQAANQHNDKENTGKVLYGSCEWTKQRK
jgi:hypothetical protein